MGKIYTCFQIKTAQKPYPLGVAHTYMAYIRGYPPPGAQSSSESHFNSYAATGDAERKAKDAHLIHKGNIVSSRNK